MTGSHISLFSGVGMTDLAVETLGFKTIATAEIDPFCRSVLKARFPDARHYADVKDVKLGTAPGENPCSDLSLLVRGPLLISGGFPCQDVSALGAGAGLAGSRSGLWSEFDRIIRAFRPDYVLVENSPVLRSRGLADILRDLYRAGYSARWDCVPAATVGAPHLRDRIFLLAALEADPSHHGGSCTFEGVEARKLPRAGTMKLGEVRSATPRATVKAARAATAVSLPTPRRASNEWRTTRNAPSHGNGHGKTLAGEVNDLERAAGRTPAATSESAGNINPMWVEWVMGLPLGWTDPSVPSGALVPHGGWDAEPEGVPRTIFPQTHRKARLMALGNGMVPAAAIHAFDILNRTEVPK